jgi:hypothetical protein
MIELRKRLKTQNQGPVKGDSSAFMGTEKVINDYFNKRGTLTAPSSSVTPVSTSVSAPVIPSVRTILPPVTKSYVEDPIMAENLRQFNETDKVRNTAVTNFWKPIKEKFTYEPNSPNRRF